MTEKPLRAVLVGVQLPGVDGAEHEASRVELTRLVRTLGYEVVGQVSQRRARPAPGTVVGEGKLVELAAWTGGAGAVPKRAPKRAPSKARVEPDEREEPVDGVEDGGESTASDGRRRADVVVVDHELSPSVARNLEQATGVPVLDRTRVIVEIFHRHARSREARLQVEIARFVYLVPHLRETGNSERQGGRGAGETTLELDRRKVRDRITQLRAELKALEAEQGTRRVRRVDQLRVALVGYTNAGKSSLMRALTGSDVLVADKLFATLDTTVRALQPESVPRILVSDTVGFIKKLPHDLVASFRSTLDEALEASLLLLVVDAGDPTFRRQLAVTQAVLAEIGAQGVPSRLVLNKIDRVEPGVRAELAIEYPDALQVSAHDAADVQRLREFITRWFDHGMTEAELIVPWTRGALASELRARVKVLEEHHEADGVRFQVRGRQEDVARLKGLIASGSG